MTRRPVVRAAPVEVERLPFLLRRAADALDRCLADTMAGDLESVSVTGLHLLAVLRRRRPLSTLAEELRVTPQAAGRAVARLEDLGLAFRGPHPRDGRAVLVELTPEGEEAAEAVRAAVEDALHLVGDELDPGRLEALVRDLEVVAEIAADRHPWDRW